MKISEETDLSYLHGYFVVSKITITKRGKDKGKVKLAKQKTYAKLSGAKNKLIELGEDVSNLEELSEKAKMESYIESAKEGAKIKDRKQKGWCSD